MRMNKLSKSNALTRATKDLSRPHFQQQQQQNTDQQRSYYPLPTPSNIHPVTFVPKMSHNWSVQDSFVSRDGRKGVKSASDIHLVLGETPRILELDINRMIIPQNHIS